MSVTNNTIKPFMFSPNSEKNENVEQKTKITNPIIYMPIDEVDKPVNVQSIPSIQNTHISHNKNNLINSVVERCSEVKIKRLSTKKINALNNTMLYPHLNVGGKIEPILCKTDYITLQNNVTYAISTNKYNNITNITYIYIKRSLTLCDSTMDELFDFCRQLDNEMEINRDTLLKECENGPNNRSYIKLVNTDERKGYEFIKIKLNTFQRYKNGNDINKSNDNDKMVKIFYKNSANYIGKYKYNRWRDYKIPDITKILRSGVNVRFILYINKLWYNLHSYGLDIKSLQIEVDDSLANKFEILNKIQKNNTNMFDHKIIQTNDIGEKILDAMKNRTIYGMNKNKIEKDNIKILSIIKNNDKSMFDDSDYVSAQDAQNLVINI